MSDRLAPSDIVRLQRAERRWLEQARERLHQPGRRTRPEPSGNTPEETDR
jgi:hypothetical protein